MNEIKLQFDDAQFKAALSESILAAISGESRDALIREAVAGLVRREIVKPQYGPSTTRPSIVENAFARAMSQIANDVIQDLVKNDPEIRAQAETLIRDTLLAFMSNKDSGYKIASALWEAIEKATR